MPLLRNGDDLSFPVENKQIRGCPCLSSLSGLNLMEGKEIFRRKPAAVVEILREIRHMFPFQRTAAASFLQDPKLSRIRRSFVKIRRFSRQIDIPIADAFAKRPQKRHRKKQERGSDQKKQPFPARARQILRHKITLSIFSFCAFSRQKRRRSRRPRA